MSTAQLSEALAYAVENELSHIEAMRELFGHLEADDLARQCTCPPCVYYNDSGGVLSATELAYRIRNHIIAAGAPYWALDGGFEEITAAEVRAEANPLLDAIIAACSDVIGDGFYPVSPA